MRCVINALCVFLGAPYAPSKFQLKPAMGLPLHCEGADAEQFTIYVDRAELTVWPFRFDLGFGKQKNKETGGITVWHFCDESTFEELVDAPKEDATPVTHEAWMWRRAAHDCKTRWGLRQFHLPPQPGDHGLSVLRREKQCEKVLVPKPVFHGL